MDGVISICFYSGGWLCTEWRVGFVFDVISARVTVLGRVSLRLWNFGRIFSEWIWWVGCWRCSSVLLQLFPLGVGGFI